MPGEWPEKPSLRFLIHWALRRDELCDPGLCPDTPDDGGRCTHCPLDKLDAAQSSGAGLLLRRALDLRAALKLGVRVDLDEIRADEFQALVVLEEEQARLEEEKRTGSPA
jgi:hypothetical protein